MRTMFHSGSRSERTSETFRQIPRRRGNRHRRRRPQSVTPSTREGRDMTLTVPVYPDLAGKVAVVTGGSRGIGAATCRLLAANGAKVVVNGRDEAAIDATVGTIRSNGGQAIGVAADCTDFAAIERMRQQVERELGPVDVLAAFVAGGHARPGPTEQTTEEDWRSTIDGTLTVTFLTVKSFLPSMIARR